MNISTILFRGIKDWSNVFIMILLISELYRSIDMKLINKKLFVFASHKIYFMFFLFLYVFIFSMYIKHTRTLGNRFDIM